MKCIKQIFVIVLFIISSLLTARCNEWVEFINKSRFCSYAIQDCIHWIDTGYGLVKYDDSTQTIEQLFEIDGKSTADIKDIFVGKDGEVYFLKQNGEIFINGGQVWVHHNSIINEENDRKFRRIRTDSDNNLWILSGYGLHQYDRITRKIINTISSVYDIETFFGDLWICTDIGLQVFHDGKWFGHELNYPDYFDYNCYFERKFSSSENQLIFYDNKNFYNVFFDGEIQLSQLALNYNQIADNYKIDNSGNIWFACTCDELDYPAPVFKFDGISLKEEGETDYVVGIDEDSSGTIWVVSNSKLYKNISGDFKSIPIWHPNIPFRELTECGTYQDIEYLSGHGEALIDRQEEGNWIFVNKDSVKITEGNFEHGKKIGIWKTYYEIETLKSEIEYKNGFKDGSCVVYHKNGRKNYTGNYTKSLKSGKWTYWDENGVLTNEGEFKNDKMNGLWITYFPDEKIKEQDNLVDNKQKGSWKETLENSFRGEVDYTDGKKTSQWKYWRPDGVQIYSLKFPNIEKRPDKLNENGHKQGLHLTFMNYHFDATNDYDSAKYYRLAEYDDGKPVGIVKDYFLDGTLQFEGKMISEFPSVYDGTIRIYDKNGSLIKEKQYENGELNGYVREWQDGNLTKDEHYKNGDKDGFCSEVYNVTKYEGNYNEGKQVGLWRIYKDNKQIEMRYYVNDSYIKQIELKIVSPVNLLQILKYNNSSPVFIVPIDAKDWNIEKYLERIVSEINSDQPVPAVNSTLCDELNNAPSTLGREAMYMLEGFIQGTYPPTESSVTDFDPDPKYYKKWWKTYLKNNQEMK